jgi:E3 ubiquitin-protein ligase SHPRH
MSEILEVLLTKAKTEAEEAQRVLLGALNGLGALMWLEGRRGEAVGLYRRALAVSEEHRAQVRGLGG